MKMMVSMIRVEMLYMIMVMFKMAVRFIMIETDKTLSSLSLEALVHIEHQHNQVNNLSSWLVSLICHGTNHHFGTFNLINFLIILYISHIILRKCFLSF